VAREYARNDTRFRRIGPDGTRYTAVTECKAIIHSETRTVTLTKGVWSGSFPIADIPHWLAFYRRQQQLLPSHASSYKHEVKALEELVEQVSGAVSANA
jgi:hypothetical protein